MSDHVLAPVGECRQILAGFHRYLSEQLAPLGNPAVGAVIGSEAWRQTCLQADALVQAKEAQQLRQYLWAQVGELMKLAKGARV